MQSPQSSSSVGISLLEVLVLVVVIAVLASLAIPDAGHGGLDRAKLIQLVSNGKQIATLATIMANDLESTGDPKLGWPGDLLTKSGAARITTVGDLVDRMIAYDYVKRGDCGKVFGGPGVPLWDGSGQLTSRECAFKIFKITKKDLGNTVFLETRNYTYNQPPNPAVKPYGDTAFIVTRKDTSSTNYSKPQYNLWQQIGTLTGQPEDSTKPAVETPAMILP